MSAAIRTSGLGRRFGRRWALADCTLSIPEGRVTGLVGPNGAGKSTLLQLAAGLLSPSAGRIEVLGRCPGSGPDHRSRVGFLAQDAPVYAALSVADHLRLGAHMNPGWDAALAARRVDDLGLDPSQRAGRLSGGQRAQLALTLAVAKRPALLLLDEPVASLDPLARRGFLQDLMAVVAEHGTSVVLSTHLVSDLERTCDHLVVLVRSRVAVAGDVDDLVASHQRLTGPRRAPGPLPFGQELVHASQTDRQTTLVVRSSVPVVDPAWHVEPLGLEDVVLAHLEAAVSGTPSPEPAALGAAA